MDPHVPDAPREAYDFIVVGSGMAGMTAAASVAAAGRRVVVVEKASELGGSTILSGGWVWTAPEPDVLITESPRAAPELVRALCSGYERLMTWIGGTGAAVSEEAVILDYGRGREVDLTRYLEVCRSAVVDTGGSVLTRSQMYSLTVEAGQVVGVEVYSAGEHVAFTAPWTLLATGGFQADPELIATYIHPNTPRMPLRSNRASTGDGLRAATAIGAATSEAMDGFYGHLVSWPSDVWVPGVFTLLSQYHSDRAALVNAHGECFRPPFDSDHYNAQWAVQQPEGRAVMVFDQQLYEDQGSPVSSGSRLNSFDVAVEHGAHAAIGGSLDELGRRIEEWGFDGSRLADSIAGYNREASGPRKPIEVAPYYALEVRAAITFTHGGLRIDADTHVLGEDGAPIPGLLAAGADAGGVHAGGYGGGLATAGVFGLRAADTVLAAGAG